MDRHRTPSTPRMPVIALLGMVDMVAVSWAVSVVLSLYR